MVMRLPITSFFSNLIIVTSEENHAKTTPRRDSRLIVSRDGERLSWFGSALRKARQSYLEFIKDGVSDTEREALRGGGLLRTAGGREGLLESRKSGELILGDERALGDNDFVEQTPKKAATQDSVITEASPGVDLERLTELVCRYFEMAPIEVRSPNKKRAVKIARAAICYIAARKSKMKGVDIAEYLNVGQSTVSGLVSEYAPEGRLINFLNSSAGTDN